MNFVLKKLVVPCVYGMRNRDLGVISSLLYQRANNTNNQDNIYSAVIMTTRSL